MFGSGGSSNPNGGASGTTFGGGGDNGTAGGNNGQGGTVSVSGPDLAQTIDDCKGFAQLAQLQAGGNPGGMKWLYPYEGTVFPRGLAAPNLMWDGSGNADAVLVTMKSQSFSYQGCFGATNPLRITLPAKGKDDDPWASAGQWSKGTGDPLEIKITVLSGGNVVGPITRHVQFALATIKGAIYYNTYDSALANHSGAVLKIAPGDTKPTVFLSDPAGVPLLGPCYSCHALSANGSVMTANHHAYPAGPYQSESWSLASNPAQLNMNSPLSNNLPEAGFAAIYPDGTFLLTNGPSKASQSLFFPEADGQPPALQGPATSQLLDTKTGQAIPANGWTAPHALMPMFSPDGKHVAFNDSDKGGGHTLFMADFDAGSKTFSNYKQLYHDDTLYPGWPFFTPDAKQVVFTVTSNSNFASQIPNPAFPIGQYTDVGSGKLMIVDVATTQAVSLDLANGFQGGQSYLPNAQDNGFEYYPTMSPVSAGGFAWMFFTSRRHAGNLNTVPSPLDPTKPYTWDPKSKKIWCTAITLDAPAGSDPSHPAFFLPGQEVDTGNMRAFAALEPCKEDGSACTSGTDCCNGYCSLDASGNGVCGVKPPQACAKIDDACQKDADCCPDDGSGNQLFCLGGFCGIIVPQ